jgi:cellulose biosynthesis protein BcsQ
MKAIAVLSGKGGSGKTSLSLCMANLLAASGIKTLLVDCDFSTNGATYFFEDILRSADDFMSLRDLVDNGSSTGKIVNIKQNFDFIPSVTKIDGLIVDPPPQSKYFCPYSDSIFSKYGVVIFDCQAGYSPILPNVLTFVDQTLFVMEADAISSASIRSLHLKIGKLLTSKSYQVFNKVTSDEYEIYNKLSGGTLFTNIESVLFDWTIRKAFALSTIPDIKNVDSRFWEQIINICKILFVEQDFQDKIRNFSKVLFSKKIQKEQETLEYELQTLQTKKAKQRRLVYMVTIPMYTFIAFVAVFFLLFDDKKDLLAPYDFKSMLIFGVTLSSMIISFLSVWLSKQKKDNRIPFIRRRLAYLSEIAEKYN